MEDKGTMEQRFGKYTLDELKKACEICLDNSKKCSDGCPLVMDGPNGCREGMITSIVELINSYKTTLTLCEHWFKRADALSDKATKYDSVRNELIRTQELLKDAQDECRKRAEKIKTLRETIDAMDDDYNELDAKLKNEEMVRRSLEVDIKNIEGLLNFKQTAIDRLIKEKAETHEELDKLQAERKDLNVQLYEANAAKIKLATENKELKDRLDFKQQVINQLMKEKDETNAALLHYHALKNSLKVIGEAMRGDQSGDHEKD